MPGGGDDVQGVDRVHVCTVAAAVSAIAAVITVTIRTSLERTLPHNCPVM